MDGLKLAVRKYRHGGLFRAFTGPFFLDAGRVTSEAEIMLYLRQKGVAVPAPFAAVIERLFVVRRLYLVSLFQENAVTLLDYLRACTRMERARAIVGLAGLLRGLEQAGVYHRDLHLKNVLVTREKRLILLDFDRAVRKTLLPGDMESMVRRLGRFADKMERRGGLRLDRGEKALFLRAYARLSGYDMTEKLKGDEKMRGWLYRTGWFIESLLFGERT
jgi:Ser/Thr protein kinase RdoA (MazF antagonist)